MYEQWKVMIRETLKSFIENEILPRHDAFDKGHRRDHIETVISQGLQLSKFYDVDPEMVYVACACHDLGIRAGRELHHLESGKIIREELPLGEWFTAEQIETIACAAEDHRASSKSEPRTIYGKIVAEADRQIVPQTVILRTIQYGLEHYPGLDREQHWERTLSHLNGKYASGGYLKLWIPESPNAARLEGLREIIADRKRLRDIFDLEFARERMKIRPAEMEDIPRILEICDEARGIMRADGNMDQWTGGYPSREAIGRDIRREVGYVVTQDGSPVAYFAFIVGTDPTYLVIDGGHWIDDTLPYGTIHRLGSTASSHGVAALCFDWCWQRVPNIRIDTHRDNSIMKHCILKAGFRYCGIIYIEDGSERLAYQKI